MSGKLKSKYRLFLASPHFRFIFNTKQKEAASIRTIRTHPEPPRDERQPTKCRRLFPVDTRFDLLLIVILGHAKRDPPFHTGCYKTTIGYGNYNICKDAIVQMRDTCTRFVHRPDRFSMRAGEWCGCSRPDFSAEQKLNSVIIQKTQAGSSAETGRRYRSAIYSKNRCISNPESGCVSSGNGRLPA